MPNASLQRAALRLHDLYAGGVLEADEPGRPGTHGFNTTPDIANYCAWFCPEEKCFFDFRLTLYPESTASAYVQVRQALLPPLMMSSDAGSELPVSDDWKEVLRGVHVNHVVLHDANLATLYQAVQRLWLQDRQHWELLYADGQSAILGWEDAPSQHGHAFAGRYIDLNSLAFGPNAQRVPKDMPSPPQPSVSWVEDAMQWLRNYWEGPAARPAEVDQTTMYLAYYEDSMFSNRAFYRAAALWAGLASPMLTPDAGAAIPLEVMNYKMLGGSLIGYVESALSARKDFGPPAAPLLAVRTARAAVAANPRSADAYLMLAQAYDALLRREEEPWLSSGSRNSSDPLVQLRHIQIVSSLRSALVLNPDLFVARNALAEQYSDYLHYYDLADDLLQENLDRQRDHGPRPGEAQEDFDARMDRQDQRLQSLEKQWNLAQERGPVRQPRQRPEPARDGQGPVGHASRPGEARCWRPCATLPRTSCRGKGARPCSTCCSPRDSSSKPKRFGGSPQRRPFPGGSLPGRGRRLRAGRPAPGEIPGPPGWCRHPGSAGTRPVICPARRLAA